MPSTIKFIIQTINPFRKGFIVPISIAVVGSLIAAYISQVSPKMDASAADQFFSGYFKGVVQASQRHMIYEQDFTEDFRRFNGWSFFGTIQARLDNCPVQDIRIDRTVWLSSPSLTVRSPREDGTAR